MKDQRKITILSIVLLISVLLNLFLFYAMGSLVNLYEDSNIQEVEEWCDMVNQGNEAINILLSELRDYDEGYKIVLDMEMMGCDFS